MTPVHWKWHNSIAVITSTIFKTLTTFTEYMTASDLQKSFQFSWHYSTHHGQSVHQIWNAELHSLRDRTGSPKWTSVQSNLATGHIAIVSPITAANAFIRCVCWQAVTCSRCNALKLWYIKTGWCMCPLKSTPSHMDVHMVPQMAPWSVQLLLHSSPVWPTHKQIHRPRHL